MKRLIFPAVLMIGLLLTGLCSCNSQHGQQPVAPQPNGTSSGMSGGIPGASGAQDAIQSGTNPPPPTVSSGIDAIATIDDITITRQQLEKPLFEGYGLNILVKVTQRELAHREARKMGLNIGPDQIKAELQRYLATLFNEDKDPVLKRLNDDLAKAQAAKDSARTEQVRVQLEAERNRLLDQLLQQQKLPRVDFDLFIETNSYLRAIAEAQVAKIPVTDEALHAAFNHLYGEKAQVLDIQLANLDEVRDAQRRLGTEPFEKVAREMSRDPQSAALGGELPPFSRDTLGLPQNYKDVVFSLKIGQISDAVSADGSYHIVMLKGLIPPNKLIKFDVVKDSVREFLVSRQVEGLVKEMRQTLQNQVLTSLKITEPTLHDQFVAQTTRKTEELHDKTDIRNEMDRKAREAKQAATRPTTGVVIPPTTQPATNR